VRTRNARACAVARCHVECGAAALRRCGTTEQVGDSSPHECPACKFSQGNRAPGSPRDVGVPCTDSAEVRRSEFAGPYPNSISCSCLQIRAPPFFNC